MATNSSQLQETILKAIDAVVTQRNNDLQLDKTILGTVKKNVGKRGTRPLYQIEYGGGIIEAVAQSSEEIYSPHSSVYVLVPQGNFSNEKIIIGRGTTITTDRSASVVAAAVNNYSIVGANLLQPISKDDKIKDIEYGLRSFHPIFRDDIEEDGIDHRAYFIYKADNKENSKIKFDDERLNIYKEDSTAIMIKADFKTNLDVIQKQQPGAKYGLIFNFAFDNLNKGYGETNGEILENISQIVRGNVLNEDGVVEEKLLYDCILDFENHLINSQNDNIEFWTMDNTGFIDQLIENTQSIYNCFKIDSAKLDKEIINNTIQSFLILLNELKYKTSISDIAMQYNLWKEEIVGDESQKYTQFVLSSDDMIGNPFNFNTWNTQYAVFNIDLETFNHLESILFYKEGFFTDTEDTRYEYRWPIGKTGGGPDIFVRNLQIYAMNPLDNKSGDYSLNVQPYGDSDIFVSKDNPSTAFKATLLRKLFEDLSANGKTNFLWFKEDSSVINSNSKNYHYLAGSGWRQLDHIGINYIFNTTIEENYAYKNNYKCIAIYEPASDDKTVLSFTFSVYNKDMSIDIKLESDLGTNFSFDAGTPTITVLINENREDPNSQYQELGYDESIVKPKYLYCWTIDDASNDYTLFLDEIFDTVVQESIQEAIILSAKQSLLKKIKTYTLEELTNKADRATRIKYPVSIASSGFTITCYVKKYNEDTERYYDIGSASLNFENKDESIVSDYRIQILNGDQVFQYDEYGSTPCSEKRKNPLTIKPLQAKLFTPSGIEVEGTNYQVEWIFPTESTMIHAAETLQLNPSTNLIQSYVGPEANFTINELYDPDAYANQITCHVHFNGKDYNKDTNFYFGKQGNNGTNGTDTIAKIEYNGIDVANILHYQPLTLYVQKNEDNSAKGMLNVGARRLQDNIVFATTDFSSQENTDSVLKLSVYQKETLIGPDNYKMGYPRWNVAGNASERSNTTGKFFEIASSSDDLSLIWYYDFNQDKKYYRLQNIKASVQLKDDQMYYAFFSLPIIEYEYNEFISISSLLPINRIAIDKDFYLNEIVYNADGRNPIYNHNQGLKLINVPSNITKIIWKAKGGLNEEENKPWISLLEERNLDNGQLTIETIPQNNTDMIYILPNDIFDGSATNNRVEAFLYDNDKWIATVYAPINMTLNTFGLSSLNAWDGNTVTIDNDGGYVMAPQVGAGEKDDNNRFTGILMGKTETYTGKADNEKEIGLFGYAYGLQSIFLDAETGNATFGLPEGNSLVKDTQGKYIGLKNDNYGEGRIELRPGDISKIGGWRIGRRSLYYTTKPTSTDISDYQYQYDGEIGPRYTGDIGTPLNKQYAAHHEKDIKTEDGGLLLSANPPYISVKGQKLTQDEIDNGLNSQLRPGDSLEIQLDPQTPTLFTIFRHNSTDRLVNKGKRQFLAGINDKGELLANGVGREDSSGTGTKSGNIILKAFKDTKDMESGSYVGSVFEAGSGLASTRTFFQIFREKTDPLNTMAQVYMTGGQVTSSGDFVGSTGNEYLRPISIHGKNIMLYADTGNPNDYILDENGEKIIVYDNIPQYDEEGELIVDDEGNPIYNPILDENGNVTYLKYGHNWTSTDANIQISTNNYQTQLGNTQFKLTRENDNLLETRGKLNVNLGASGNRKALDINAASSSMNLYTGDTNYYKQIIDNTNGIKITTSKPYNYTSTSTSYNINLNNIKINASNNKLQLFNSGSTYTNSILLNNDNGTWETGHNLTLQNTNQLKIYATNTGNGSQYSSSRSWGQIVFQAGTVTENETAAQLFLNSSNNTWKTGYSYTDSDGKKQTKTAGGSKTNSWFRINETRRNQGIYLYDTVETTNNKDTVYTYFGIDAKESDFSGGIRIQGVVDGNPVNKADSDSPITTGLTVKEAIYTNSKYYGDSTHAICDGASSTGSASNASGLGGSGSATFSSVELQANGRPKLHTHTFSVSIPSGSTIYEAIKASIATQIKDALPDLSGYAKKSDLSDYAKSSDLDNCLKKNTNYTYTTAVMTYTTTAGTAIDGKTVLTTVTDHTTSTFRVS